MVRYYIHDGVIRVVYGSAHCFQDFSHFCSTFISFAMCEYHYYPFNSPVGDGPLTRSSNPSNKGQVVVFNHQKPGDHSYWDDQQGQIGNQGSLSHRELRRWLITRDVLRNKRDGQSAGRCSTCITQKNKNGGAGG